MNFLKPSQYQGKAQLIFGEMRSKLLKVLPDVEVEHVGSSAIKDALSKGDLDILVRTSKDNFENALQQIQKINFSIKKDTLRSESLCMLESQDFEIDVAIQLIVKDSKFENFVKFRNCLNKNPNLVSKYNDLKLSSKDLTSENYRLKKSKFIEEILATDPVPQEQY